MELRGNKFINNTEDQITNEEVYLNLSQYAHKHTFYYFPVLKSIAGKQVSEFLCQVPEP